MSKFTIKKEQINRYLPRWDQYRQNVTVFYDPDTLRFNCTKCGCCCDLRLLPEFPTSDPFSLSLCDLDVKRLYKLSSDQNYRSKFPANVIGCVRADILHSTNERIITIEKIDGKCVFFNVESKECEIYDYRPFTCRVYPWLIGEIDSNTYKILIDRDRVPCPRECFRTKPIPLRKLLEITTRHLVLEKRKILAESTWRELTHKVANSDEFKPFKEQGEHFMSQVINGKPDLEQDFIIPINSKNQFLVKSWIYCDQNDELIQKFKQDFDKGKKIDDSLIKERSSDLLSTESPIAVFIINLYQNGQLVGIQINRRRPNDPSLAEFDELDGKELFQWYISRQLGSFSESLKEDPEFIKIQKLLVF